MELGQPSVDAERARIGPMVPDVRGVLRAEGPQPCELLLAARARRSYGDVADGVAAMNAAVTRGEWRATDNAS